mgnify:CR=1 FL=1|tara:strand:+ start:449 stop:745 length:297 start_codon:yes stop_codon:yes gene_type:complete
MFVNVIKTYRCVVAVCDENLLGEKFEENKFQLDVKENFFMGKKTSEKETIEIMKQMFVEDATFNIIGEESVNAAIKAEIISKENINKINGIPFSLALS